ncbi:MULTISPECIES: tryptophan synthase subunit alpha [Bacillaceae]|uniref:Tryptophan synthase alpha chain n=1 Tax=Evansella alkalicola TaxID=745819 RepID=A0ABS6JZC4_9BACI|nr:MULTISPECIES: tryptophan synthase subunit alpha [Bacillaceae]MBU9723941.1 tryptophan synthase subunit alpha [Bacillus alkalicola]
MNRLLDPKFVNKTKRFVPYIMAGDPTLEASIDIALTLQEAGVDAIEWGVPFSDPLADGPVIQEAGERARKLGMNIERAVDGVKLAREKGLTIPVILFSYINPVLAIGEGRLLSLMSDADIDGLLIPDLPVEESDSIRAECRNVGISLIPLITLSSRDRIEKICQNGEGFIYFVSSHGVTGTRESFSEKIADSINTIKKYTDVPVLVGFGISQPQHVSYFNTISDGVIVGSALVHLIGEQKYALMHKRDKVEGLDKIKEFVLELNS